jgi:hypothetical protein
MVHRIFTVRVGIRGTSIVGQERSKGSLLRILFGA